MVAPAFITAVSIAVASIVVQPCAVELPWASELPRLVLLLTGLTEPTEAIAAAATNLTPPLLLASLVACLGAAATE